jgi:hypothetical protein
MELFHCIRAIPTQIQSYISGDKPTEKPVIRRYLGLGHINWFPQKTIYYPFIPNVVM